jgi:UDP-3-O-[3-hydroxymyristoyl] N-acetylglucosamine deacetylase
VAFGVDNAEIEIDGPEVPLMDGSAQIWVEQIQRAGLVEQAQSRSSWRLAEPIWVQEQDAFVVGFPAEQIQLSYEINFPDFGPIGRQWYGLELNSERFSQEIAPARTFGLASQVEELRTLGLIKGGTLDNALVCNQNQWLNPPLRFDQEPVRHKLLDLIGDLSLLGQIPKAHILAHKASHKLHVAFAQKIQAKLIPEQLSAS